MLKNVDLFKCDIPIDTIHDKGLCIRAYISEHCGKDIFYENKILNVETLYDSKGDEIYYRVWFLAQEISI